MKRLVVVHRLGDGRVCSDGLDLDKNRICGTDFVILLPDGCLIYRIGWYARCCYASNGIHIDCFNHGLGLATWFVVRRRLWAARRSIVLAFPAAHRDGIASQAQTR